MSAMKEHAIKTGSLCGCGATREWVEHATWCPVARHARAVAEAAKPKRCERCGSPKPVGQSCDCFDNGCQ